ncbi:MAG: hypothetical protein ACLRKV_11920 [Mediterraneibacter faecis]
MSRAKNPKYESMSLEELKANMEKSRQELEAAIHHKNILEQRKKLGRTQGTFPPADCQRGRV